jgi:hypothetical protein
MNWAATTAFKSNEIDYYFEKNSISQCEKKCLAFLGLLQFPYYAYIARTKLHVDDGPDKFILTFSI